MKRMLLLLLLSACQQAAAPQTGMTPVTLNVQDAPVPKVLEALSQQSGLRIEAPDCVKNTRIDLRINNAPIKVAMALLEAMLKLDVQDRGTELVLSCKGEVHLGRKVSVNAQNAPIQKVLQDLAQQAGLEEARYEGPPKQISLHLQNVQLKLALEVIIDSAGLQGYRFNGAKLTVFRSKKTETVQRPLPKPSPTANPAPNDPLERPDRSEAEAPPPEAPPSSGAAFTAGPHNLPGYALRGAVRYKGRFRNRSPSAPASIRWCKLLMGMGSGDLHEPKIVVDGDRLQGALVYLELTDPEDAPQLKGWPKPRTPQVVSLVYEGCRVPQLVALQLGSKLMIENRDPTLHNAHGLAKRGEFNQALPLQGSKLFKKPRSSFPFTCDLHPWERSRVEVLPHGYFDVTNAKGRFNLDLLPRGRYTLVVHHPELPPQRFEIEHTNARALHDLELKAR